MTTTALRHVLISTDDFERTRQFYGDVLGIEEMEAPATGYDFTMQWYRIGDADIHVVQKDAGFAHSNPGFNPTQEPHVAFEVSDIEEVERRLTAAGCEVLKVGQLGVLSRKQVWTRDPSGMVIELYEPRE